MNWFRAGATGGPGGWNKSEYKAGEGEQEVGHQGRGEGGGLGYARG